ncbi:hypothetical protein BST65_09615 [Bradyrhizobium canariense]|nr:hypothetical protein BST65_09615 [Bradyrhizobium canariense]OSI37363.1 hypothetical protein BST66_03380 [Bradyrhizobium canariense]OSI52472.1 hypothetical protein BSZ20_03855 [Bradyrhizobium canariense]OSI56492.1 hypothetical protein BST67_03345 [Bradyrhizobium canariense]OSI59505.1 hypothetical protein BSZ15_04420 [Bradyrhizobium canariense]
MTESFEAVRAIFDGTAPRNIKFVADDMGSRVRSFGLEPISSQTEQSGFAAASLPLRSSRRLLAQGRVGRW